MFIHGVLFDLAGERIAPPAEAFGGILAPATAVSQRGIDENPFKACSSLLGDATFTAAMAEGGPR